MVSELNYWLNSVKWIYIVDGVFLVLLLALGVFSEPIIISVYSISSIGLVGVRTVVHFVSFIMRLLKGKVDGLKAVLSNYLVFILMQGVTLMLARLMGVFLVDRIRGMIIFSFVIFVVIYLLLTLMALGVYSYFRKNGR